MMSFSYKNVIFSSFVLFFLVVLLGCFTACNTNLNCNVDDHRNNPTKCSDQYSFDENKKSTRGANGICDKAELLELSDVEDYYYLNLLSVQEKNNKRIINASHTKIEFEESSSGVKIPYNKISDMIDFTSSSKDGGKFFEIIDDNIIAPCFDNSDTVDVRVEWNIKKNKDKFHNTVSSQSSIILSFVSKNRRDYGKASCYSLPYISNVSQPKINQQICDIKVEIEGMTDAEFKNSNLEISLTDSLTGFVSNNYFKWNDVKDQLKSQNFVKNVWVRVKGKANTLRAYRNNGEVYSGTCKPISQSTINERKEVIKNIINKFFRTNSEEARDELFDNITLFRELNIANTAQAKSTSSVYDKEAGSEESLELFLQDFVFQYAGKSVDLVVKDVEFNKSGKAIMIIIEKEIGK